MKKVLLALLISTSAHAQLSQYMRKGDLVVAPGTQRTIWVNSDGGVDGTNCGAVSSTPCFSMQAAVNSAPIRKQGPVTIAVVPGTYQAGAYIPSNHPETINDGGAWFEIACMYTDGGYGWNYNVDAGAGLITSGTVSSTGGGTGAFVSLTVSPAPNWVDAGLRGLLWCNTGGTGAGRCAEIVSNDAADVFVALDETETFADNTTTFALAEPGCILADAGLPLPAAPNQALQSSAVATAGQSYGQIANYAHFIVADSRCGATAPYANGTNTSGNIITATMPGFTLTGFKATAGGTMLFARDSDCITARYNKMVPTTGSTNGTTSAMFQWTNVNNIALVGNYAGLGNVTANMGFAGPVGHGGQWGGASPVLLGNVGDTGAFAYASVRSATSADWIPAPGMINSFFNSFWGFAPQTLGTYSLAGPGEFESRYDDIENTTNGWGLYFSSFTSGNTFANGGGGRVIGGTFTNNATGGMIAIGPYGFRFTNGPAFTSNGIGVELVLGAKVRASTGDVTFTSNTHDIELNQTNTFWTYTNIQGITLMDGDQYTAWYGLSTNQQPAYIQCINGKGCIPIMPSVANASLPVCGSTLAGINSTTTGPGAQMYDSTNNKMAYCNGTAWTEP